MRTPLHRTALAAAAALLAACSAESTTAPRLAPPADAPARLVAPGENMNMLVDSTDASGNHVMIAEYAAGTILEGPAAGTSVASVTIRTFIPAVPTGSTSSSSPCITSTVVATEVTPGWTASVKKPGGCDKEIVVGLENRSTGQKAQFSFLYIFGKTRIDFGAVR